MTADRLLPETLLGGPAPKIEPRSLVLGVPRFFSGVNRLILLDWNGVAPVTNELDI